ncbi:MAG: CPXCG motif-containing cysteine-rich protein [Gammaproteobacteria bacterium]|nr:CPXCG motif-containing cysteine-rich protein [Gammaproteobacteria bacterium]
MLTHVDCPYCGEHFETNVDTSAGSQDYIEDCPVCCRPIEFHLAVGTEADDFTLVTGRDDD